MQPENLREPQLNDLCCLTMLGNAVYAVRCARRMQPRFRVPGSPHEDQMKTIVNNAIGWAEKYVQTGEGLVERGEELAKVVSEIANATCDETDYAAFAAFHSVRGAILVAQNPTQADADAFMQIVAAAFGSSRVLMANVPSWFRALAVKSMLADYEKLLALGTETGTQRGPLIDATEQGPLGALWQGPTPTW
jgi:hypothetical protein